MPLIVETYPAETPYSQTIYPQKYRNCFHIYPDLWPENTPGSEDCCESEIADHEADTIAGFLLEKEDILSEISGKTIVFHCISPIISAFAAELLRRGQTVIVLLPEMNPELIQKIFSDSDDRDLMEFSPPSRPIHVTKFPSFHALKERSDRQFYTPVLTAKKRKESPTLSDMLIHWQDILHNDDACRAFSVLQGLLDPDEGPDGWRHTLVHFLDKLPDVLAADEDSPLSLLRLTAPYAAAYAASDAEIFLGALEEYLLTSEYTEPDALPPNLFDFLSQPDPDGHLALLSDELLCPPPCPDHPTPAERAYWRCLAMQGEILLHLIEEFPGLSLSYAEFFEGNTHSQHLFSPLEFSAEIVQFSPAIPDDSEPIFPPKSAEIRLPALPYNRTEAMSYFLCPRRYALDFCLAEKPVFSTRKSCLSLAENILLDWTWRIHAGKPSDPEAIRQTIDEQSNLLHSYLPLGNAQNRREIARNVQQYIETALTEGNQIRSYAPSHARMRLLYGQATFSIVSVSGENAHPSPAFEQLITGHAYRRQFSLHSIPKQSNANLLSAMQGSDFSPQNGPWCQHCPHNTLCGKGGEFHEN